MTIHYKINVHVATQDILRVYNGSGIRRPTHDVPRIEKMFAQANLIASAWEDDKLIGIARALTDHSYCCYLSDLAVDLGYQRQGVGHQLIHAIRDQLSDQVSLILLSAPDAMDYYPKVGFSALTNAFAIARKH
jgi:GNAT superfamily N-acetyltransferase